MILRAGEKGATTEGLTPPHRTPGLMRVVQNIPKSSIF